MIIFLKSRELKFGKSRAERMRQQSLEDSKLARLSFLRIPMKISSLAWILFSEKNLTMTLTLRIRDADHSC